MFTRQIHFHVSNEVHLEYRMKIQTLFHYKHMRINGTQYTFPVERMSQLFPVYARYSLFVCAKP